MFAYTVENGPSQNSPIWSHVPIQPLAPGALTHFSFSVHAEIVGRAWYNLYDQLGFEPRPRARLLRRHRGHIYQNITLSAALEADHAGIRPPAYLVNRQRWPASAWEKPGFLAGIKTGRAQRKLEDTLATSAAGVDALVATGRRWLLKTQEIRWSQAEILQVMEEIERVSMKSMEHFVDVRYRLYHAYNALVQIVAETAPALSQEEVLTAINLVTGDVDDLVENKIAQTVMAIAAETPLDDATRTWLGGRDLQNWRDTCPSPALTDSLGKFLQQYGHRCADEGEIATPRWLDDPTPVLHAILACTNQPVKHNVRISASSHIEKLLEMVGSRQQKHAEELVQQIRALLRYQSRALDALAYFLAGTRNWAFAAGREAAADGRLAAPADVFCFELEEMKQMMTGEWNISSTDEIRATADARKAELATWKEETPGELLIGDVEAQPVLPGLPGTAGKATGPLRRWDHPEPQICNGAVVGVPQLDSGWSLLLPIAQGFVTASGSPLDPLAVAARQWHTPMILGLGPRYATLVEGAQTTIDVETVLVDQ